MMVWKFCEQEIYSSPPNSSSQQTSSNDFVLLSLMYKNARDTLLHSSVSQFTDLQKTSNSAELHLPMAMVSLQEGPKELLSHTVPLTPRGRRARQEGTAWSESPCHEAGLRRAASIGAATAVRSAVTALVTAMTAPSHLGRAAHAQLQPRATGRPDGTGCMCGQVKGSKDLEEEMVEVIKVIQGENNMA